MSEDKDRLARELLEALDMNFKFIRAAFPQVVGVGYQRAFVRLETAYNAWKVVK